MVSLFEGNKLSLFHTVQSGRWMSWGSILANDSGLSVYVDITGMRNQMFLAVPHVTTGMSSCLFGVFMLTVAFFNAF